MPESEVKIKGIILKEETVLVTESPGAPSLKDQLVNITLPAGSPSLTPGSLMEFTLLDPWDKTIPLKVQATVDGLISLKNSILKIPIENGPALKDQLQEDAVLVDVRTPGEFAGGHMPGAVNLPLHHIHQQIRQQVPNHTEPVIVYCQTGHRSGLAAKLLKLFGYSTVIDLGGLNDFKGNLVK